MLNVVQTAAPASRAQSARAMIDALLIDIPGVLRHRQLVSSLAWSHASTEQVDTLLESIDLFGKPPPTWLLHLLLLADHPIPVRYALQLVPEAQALALLNRDRAASLPQATKAAVMGRCRAGALEADVTAALVEKLALIGEEALACRLGLAIWFQHPEALRPVRRSLEATIATMPVVRLRIAAFSTVDAFAAHVRLAFAAQELNAQITVAPYATALSELMHGDRTCDALVLLLDNHTQLGIDWRMPATQRVATVRERTDTLCAAIEAFSCNGGAPLLITTLDAPGAPLSGHVDVADPAGAAGLARQLNERLAQLASRLPGVMLVDADCALRELAPAQRFDPRLWHYGRVAFTDEASRRLAAATAQAWSSRIRGPAKVLALDFDDTLWGGVYGDDGAQRLVCGDDAPGNAFKAMQEECLRLKSQGMLLVGLSKNNADALGVFSTHPGMALRPDDFVATAINWRPKADNIKQLATELNLGLDSFVFLDDSAYEREAMRSLCPEVIVPELPDDPAVRPFWLRQLSVTWPARPTEEDAQRTDLYRATREAEALKASSISYEDYLLNLAQTLDVGPISAPSVARAAQLHQRTNQYNLTTLRLGEAELAERMASSETYLALVGRVKDRLGDHGIVVSAVVAIDGSTAVIESFVMSCRVIARSVETAFLGALLEKLQARGVVRVEAGYIPTRKNKVVRGFYKSHGFVPLSTEPSGAERWFWCADTCALPRTPYIATTWTSP